MPSTLVPLFHPVGAARARRCAAEHVTHAAAPAAPAVPGRTAAAAARPGTGPVRIAVPSPIAVIVSTPLPVSGVPRRAVGVVSRPGDTQLDQLALSAVPVAKPGNGGHEHEALPPDSTVLLRDAVRLSSLMTLHKGQVVTTRGSCCHDLLPRRRKLLLKVNFARRTCHGRGFGPDRLACPARSCRPCRRSPGGPGHRVAAPAHGLSAGPRPCQLPAACSISLACQSCSICRREVPIPKLRFFDVAGWQHTALLRLCKTLMDAAARLTCHGCAGRRLDPCRPAAAHRAHAPGPAVDCARQNGIRPDR